MKTNSFKAPFKRSTYKVNLLFGDPLRCAGCIKDMFIDLDLSVHAEGLSLKLLLWIKHLWSLCLTDEHSSASEKWSILTKNKQQSASCLYKYNGLTMLLISSHLCKLKWNRDESSELLLPPIWRVFSRIPAVETKQTERRQNSAESDLHAIKPRLLFPTRQPLKYLISAIPFTLCDFHWSRESISMLWYCVVVQDEYKLHQFPVINAETLCCGCSISV